LIDKINHHQFQPLFYQVAASQIEPSSISFPIRNIFRKKDNVAFRMATITFVDTDNKIVQTDGGNFPYDYFVIAIGCKTNFFGNKEIEANALTLKATADAIAIRNHVLQTFEDIIAATDYDKESLLNLVIVGAGPTGVELAGSFAEIKKHILPKDYPNIDFSSFKITLVEGSKHTLNSMSKQSKETSAAYLQEMGVHILTETFVKNYDGQTLTLSNGTTIITKTVIWAAGVTGNSIEGLPKESFTVGNRIIVDRQNKIKAAENIYAIGDISYMETPLYPKAHPQLANVAINQAKTLAKNLSNTIQQKPFIDYEYKDLGSMATIGRHKAVVDIGKFHIKGYFAWLIWMFLHLMLILSVKNKLIIFINWAWAYFTYDSSLRLILTPSKNKEKTDTPSS
jgi:NADH:ubiquinone reductase (H+-translocating)